MGKKNIVILSLFAACLWSCGGVVDKNRILLDDVEINPSETVTEFTLSDILDDYSVVELETNDSCLVGMDKIKIIKDSDRYYVRSYNEIMIFDKDGSFIGKLSRVGNGPEEYASISDFDIVRNDADPEIWIAAEGGIHKYSAESGDFLGMIPFDGYASRIENVNDSTLIVASSGEKWLHAVGPDGVIRHSFFDADIANGGNKIQQFNDIDGKICYQIEGTNEVAAYNPESDSFEMMEVFGSVPGIQTMDINREYLEKYGDMEYRKRVYEDYDNMIYYRVNGKNVIGQIFGQEGQLTFFVSDGDKVNCYSFKRSEGDKVNDLFPGSNIRFLTTPIATKSDDGFLFLIDDEKGDRNPSILDVRKFRVN